MSKEWLSLHSAASLYKVYSEDLEKQEEELVEEVGVTKP